MSVPVDNDWFQTEVLDLVNQAIHEAGYQEQFLILPGRDQSAEAVFVSPEIYEAAIKNGIIPKGDAFMINSYINA